MMLSVAILAGGLATRLRPLTETLPKALIRVNHIPFIDYQLHDLKQQGIGHVVLCLGYLGEMVETHVGDGSRYGLAVEYSYDGEYYLGTCGAIKKLCHCWVSIFLFYMVTHFYQLISKRSKRNTSRTSL